MRIARAMLGPAVFGLLVSGGAVFSIGLSSCTTLDLGDNVPPPELNLDEDFFYCRIQPEVLSAQTCASGAAGEMGACHSARSALRLSVAAESEPPPPCQGDMLVGPVPMSYQANFTAVQFTVQADPLSSPLYRRPINLDSHPRQIFAADSPEAILIRDWITAGAR